VNAQRADNDAADDGQRVAGSSESVRQEEYAGTDRALQQMHEHGEISAIILSQIKQYKITYGLIIPDCLLISK